MKLRVLKYLFLFVFIASVPNLVWAKETVNEEASSYLCAPGTTRIQIGDQVFEVPRKGLYLKDENGKRVQRKIGLQSGCYKNGRPPIKAARASFYPKGMDSIIDSKFHGKPIFKSASRVSISFSKNRTGKKREGYKTIESLLKSANLNKVNFPLRSGYYEIKDDDLGRKLPFPYIYRRSYDPRS